MQILRPRWKPFISFKDESAVVAKRLLPTLASKRPSKKQQTGNPERKCTTYSRPTRSIPHGPHSTPMHCTMVTPPILTFPLRQSSSTPSIPRLLVRRAPPPRRSASPLRAQAPKSPLLLSPLPSPHRRLRAIHRLVEVAPLLPLLLHRQSAIHIRRAGEPRRFPSQPPDLPFTITFPLLNLFFR